MTSYYVWNGQIYYGAKALAEDAGVSVRRVYRHLDAHGDLYELTGKVLHWGGRKFTSVAAVAEAAGVSRYTVYWHLREHGSLERLGAGRWGGKSPQSGTSPYRSTTSPSTAVQKGATA